MESMTTTRATQLVICIYEESEQDNIEVTWQRYVCTI